MRNNKTILFKNAKVLDLNSKNYFISADVLVTNDTITKIDKNIDLDADEIIDVNKNILMSGFVNCHTHLPMTLLRGLKNDLKLENWLFDYIIPTENKLSETDKYYGALLGICECFRAGITCCEDMYSGFDGILKAFRESGMRGRIAIGYVSCENLKEEKFYKENYEKFKKEDIVKPYACIHSLYGTTEDEQKEMIEFSKKKNIPVGLHLSETLKEVGDCTVKYNQTPAEYCESEGIFDRKCVAYHCVNMDKDDLEILSNYKVDIVTCPSSNIKLASGIAPVYAMQNKGINICIGTDGTASNDSLDMFKEMFLVSTLSKVDIGDASVVSVPEVLKMATTNGAKTLGFNDIGEIKVGNKADLILIDTKKPHWQPNENLLSHLVYSAKSSDVYLTMINGKIVYENGKITTIDENFVSEKVNQIFSKLRS